MRRAAAFMALLACARPEAPRFARIVSASPSGSDVAPDAVVASVTVTEPLDPVGVADGRYFALARAEDLREVALLASQPAGLPAGAPVVAGEVELVEGGRRAELRPRSPLAPMARYALVLSSEARTTAGHALLDPQGRLRTFAALFETGPTPDRVPPQPRWDEPPHGPVPANLRELRVAFSEPVTGTLGLPGQAGAVPFAAADDRLGLQLGANLAPGPLELALGAVRDAAGNPAAPLGAIDVSACEDRDPPLLDPATLVVTGGELSLSARAEAGEMARLVLEVAAGAEGGCGAVPAPPALEVVRGPLLPCPGFDPCAPEAVRCPLSLDVAGLCPGRTLAVRVHAEDLAGNASAPGPWIEVATAPPAPRPVLTEVRADAATPEAGGEYVEVSNLGTGDLELTGWILEKRTPAGATTWCALAGMPGGPVPPGGAALVVGGAYDGRYAAPVPTFRCGATALLGGLSNETPPALILATPAGTIVSTLGAVDPLPRCTRAVERIHPAGPDAASNLACAPVADGSPGACNGATPPQECPAQPW